MLTSILKHIPDLQVRHMVLQVLAWMWCVFSMYVGSFFVMGVSMIAHAILLAAIVATVGTFKVAKDKPEFFEEMGTIAIQELGSICGLTDKK